MPAWLRCCCFGKMEIFLPGYVLGCADFRSMLFNRREQQEARQRNVPADNLTLQRRDTTRARRRKPALGSTATGYERIILGRHFLFASREITDTGAEMSRAGLLLVFISFIYCCDIMPLCFLECDHYFCRVLSSYETVRTLCTTVVFLSL